MELSDQHRGPAVLLPKNNRATYWIAGYVGSRAGPGVLDK
jgi:hypothetical protein